MKNVINASKRMPSSLRTVIFLYFGMSSSVNGLLSYRAFFLKKCFANWNILRREGIFAENVIKQIINRHQILYACLRSLPKPDELYRSIIA